MQQHGTIDNAIAVRNRKDAWLGRVLLLMALISASVVLWIALFLFRESWPLLDRQHWQQFFTDQHWQPLEGHYSLLPMLAGSFIVTLGAILLATPLALLAALFCRYYAPKVLGNGFRRLLELLAGVPSVVFGFWGLMTLVPLINQWHAPGASTLAAILVLAFMILPLAALAADTSLSQVPLSYQHAAVALGLTRWAMIRRLALPVAGPGIIAGIVLQSGRALGETMAVLMVAGNVVQVPTSVFAPVRTITANIALEMAYAVNDHRTALFVSGLLLLLSTALLVWIATAVQQSARA